MKALKQSVIDAPRLAGHGLLHVLCAKRRVAAGSSNLSQQSLMSWDQKVITLPSVPRGCHLITNKIAQNIPELLQYEVGMANIFIQHTSASLTINENACVDVRTDLNDALDRLVPEGDVYRHDEEGSDDMPAHVKSSLMGASLDIPISHGKLALGTWQGIYLNEHRNMGGPRTVVVTVQGRKRSDGRSYGQSIAR